MKEFLLPSCCTGLKCQPHFTLTDMSSKTSCYLLHDHLFFFLEFCKMKTEDNKCCAFPFVYRGTTYSACTLRRGRKPWCSLSPNYDMNRQYGYCKGNAMLTGLFLHKLQRVRKTWAYLRVF